LQTEQSNEKEEMARRSPNVKNFLTCMECGKESPLAPSMPEAREQAEGAGWQIGMRGSTRITGWEEDFCETCKVRHPRIVCSGYRSRCAHRALYTIVRPKDDRKVYACGSHLTILVKEMIPGGKLDLEETPV
jgi:hypothetical protein